MSEKDILRGWIDTSAFNLVSKVKYCDVIISTTKYKFPYHAILILDLLKHDHEEKEKQKEISII